MYLIRKLTKTKLHISTLQYVSHVQIWLLYLEPIKMCKSHTSNRLLLIYTCITMATLPTRDSSDSPSLPSLSLSYFRHTSYNIAFVGLHPELHLTVIDSFCEVHKRVCYSMPCMLCEHFPQVHVMAITHNCIVAHMHTTCTHTHPFSK